MEMLIVIPDGHRLAVFQQVALDRPAGSAAVGIAQGTATRAVTGIGARVLSESTGRVMVVPQSQRFALRYSIPWNGRSGSFRLVSPVAVGGLLVLMPPRLSLPPVLNPSLESIGKGKIPGVRHSPTFAEYGTTHVGAGQTVPVVIEKTSASPQQGSAGTYPGAARMLEWAMGVMAFGGLIMALNWRSGALSDVGAAYRARCLGELASLRAAFRRGDLDADVYQAERQELLASLGRVWRTPDA